jgi:hypothetical protein
MYCFVPGRAPLPISGLRPLWTDSWTVGQSDRQTVRQTDGQSHWRLVDGRTVGRTVGQTDARTDGWTVGQTDGRAHGWRQERLDSQYKWLEGLEFASSAACLLLTLLSVAYLSVICCLSVAISFHLAVMWSLRAHHLFVIRLPIVCYVFVVCLMLLCHLLHVLVICCLLKGHIQK